MYVSANHYYCITTALCSIKCVPCNSLQTRCQVLMQMGGIARTCRGDQLTYAATMNTRSCSNSSPVCTTLQCGAVAPLMLVKHVGQMPVTARFRRQIAVACCWNSSDSAIASFNACIYRIVTCASLQPFTMVFARLVKAANTTHHQSG